MAVVAKAMACPESGLEVRDRMWLKITIANAFIGTSVKVGSVGLFFFLSPVYAHTDAHICSLQFVDLVLH